MRKRALLVGINNYRKPDCALEGCVADIDSMAGLLKRYYGFRDAGMTILADADATKPNIVAGLNELLFDFDVTRNDRRQFLWMNFGGYLAVLLTLIVYAWLLPFDRLAGQVAIGGIAVGGAALFLIELPITIRVLRGAEPPPPLVSNFPGGTRP